MARLKDLLERQSLGTFVGRSQEIESLLSVLSPDGPLLMWMHGIAGIGKSRLLEIFAAQARSRGVTVVRLDCRQIEPTETGLLRELGVAIGGETASIDQVAARLSQFGSRVVLALDTYEVLRLLDTWMRQVFVPSLPDNVRVILCGRDAPIAAWPSAPGWPGLFHVLRLESLPEPESLELLRKSGLSIEEARHMNRVARGHPLALTLASSIFPRAGGMNLEQESGQRVFIELSRMYVSDIQDGRTRQALEAASVIRRITGPLLRAMLPQAPPQDALERLRTLPFIEPGPAGLQMHDAVREAIAANLRADDPLRYRAHRRAAYRELTAELRSAPPGDLWYYTADLLYILENPVVREAFFPTGANDYSLEPARSNDGDAVMAIVAEHEGPLGRRCLEKLWNYAPETFCVARDRKGSIAGFYCAFDPRTTKASAHQDDPVVRAWLNHLEEHPIPAKQRVFFLRRWLSREEGEAPSAVQAACWLDVKRKYLELRPDLRRVYLALRDLAPYAPAALRLGFQVLAGSVENEKEVYYSAMLDFGPASVDGWLARLVAAELGFEESGLLDHAARELVFNGRRVGLTKLEFGVMEYLSRHDGEAVSRAALLQNVWGQTFDGGSNVVDVVIRGLRKKLSDQASRIESVQGIGYRLRGEHRSKEKHDLSASRVELG